MIVVDDLLSTFVLTGFLLFRPPNPRRRVPTLWKLGSVSQAEPRGVRPFIVTRFRRSAATL